MAVHTPRRVPDRRGESDTEALDTAAAILDSGGLVVVFPEGTRVAPGERRDYQIGGAWLAAASGVPVVPVAHNAGLFWPRNAFLKRPGTVTIRIGPSIDAANRDPKTINRLAETWIEEQQKSLCPTAS